MKKLLIYMIGLLIVACAPATLVSPETETEAADIEIVKQNRLSADGQTVVKSAFDEETTEVFVWDKVNEVERGQFSYTGGWVVTAVSANGRYFVLTAHPSQDEEALWRATNQWQTLLRVFDTTTGEEQHAMQLEGNFEVEAIDNAGESVYLIEHIPAINPEKYRVRLYDLTIKELAADPLRDKRVQDEFMTGHVWGTAASADGEWLMTLYMNANRNTAFIHALNLNNRFTFCLDLPSGNGDFEKLKHYTLALAPDNQTVYAANAALGRLVGINMEDLGRTHSVVFDPIVLTRADTMHASIISGDGQKLYFSAAEHLWQYDIASHTVAAPMLFEAPIEHLEHIDETGSLIATLQNQTNVTVSPKAFALEKGSEANVALDD